MYCKECGELIASDAKFCPNCGVKQIEGPQFNETIEQEIVVHKCPLCDAIMAPILNKNGKQFGSVCAKCDPDIRNNQCPVCHKTFQVNVENDNCTSCGYSWRMQNSKMKTQSYDYNEVLPGNNTTQDNEYVKCPNCKSTDISANKKGYRVGNAVAGVVLTGGIGLLGGFLGSNKVKITCLKCGYQWDAGKK